MSKSDNISKPTQNKPKRFEARCSDGSVSGITIGKPTTFDVTLDVKGALTKKEFFGFQLITEKSKDKKFDREVEENLSDLQESLGKLKSHLSASDKSITKETKHSLGLLTLILNITVIKLHEDRQKDKTLFYGSQELPIPQSSTNQDLKTGKSRPT